METKERILLSAKRLFSEKGYYGTSVEEIVRDAGLSKGAFYFYFKSKEDVFKELIEKIHGEIMESLGRWKGRGGEEALKGFILELVEKLYEERDIVNIFLFQTISCGEEFRKLYFEKTGEVKEGIKELLEEDEREILSDIILGFIRQVVLEYVIKERREKEFIKDYVKRGLERITEGRGC
ncbi:TetR/AcrR family transcriptional regulator [Aquifex pyrophilus]